jgi:hypothetical protein
MTFSRRTLRILFNGLLCGMALGQALPALAQDRAIQEPPIRYGLFDVAYVVNADMSSSETRQWTLTVLNAQTLEWAKRASISYSTRVQKVEVLKAQVLYR